MKSLNLRVIFKRLGLPKHSSEIYELLLKHGPMLASAVVSLSNAHRPAAYHSLLDLQKAGLVTRIQHGKRHLWKAEDPARIPSLFGKEVQDIQKLIPHAPSPSEAVALPVTGSMSLYKGKSGIRAVFDDVIEHSSRGSTFYRYTSERDLDAVNSYLSKDYRKRRDAKHLERKVISNPVSGSRKSKRLDRFIKFMPSESGIFTQNVIQLIYRDRVAFIDLNKEEAFVIENAELADFQKVIFRQLYGKL